MIQLQARRLGNGSNTPWEILNEARSLTKAIRIEAREMERVNEYQVRIVDTKAQPGLAL